MPDEVNGAWFINGKICYENNAGNVHVVKFNEYEQWINLPWPKINTRKHDNSENKVE